MAFLSLKKRGRMLTLILVVVVIATYFVWPKEKAPIYQTQQITRGDPVERSHRNG